LNISWLADGDLVYLAVHDDVLSVLVQSVGGSAIAVVFVVAGGG